MKNKIFISAILILFLFMNVSAVRFNWIRDTILVKYIEMRTGKVGTLTSDSIYNTGRINTNKVYGTYSNFTGSSKTNDTATNSRITNLTTTANATMAGISNTGTITSDSLKVNNGISASRITLDSLKVNNGISTNRITGTYSIFTGSKSTNDTSTNSRITNLTTTANATMAGVSNTGTITTDSLNINNGILVNRINATGIFRSSAAEFGATYEPFTSTNGFDVRVRTWTNEAVIVGNNYWKNSGPYEAYNRNGGAGYLKFDISTGTTAGDIIFATAASGLKDAQITFTERMRIKQLGSVGVGTSSPGEKLHVAGNVIVEGDIYSPGIKWTSRTSASDQYWIAITYGNGLFVALGYSGSGNRIMTSPDGINWTMRNSNYDNNWFDLTYGNGLFVAVAGSGTGNRVMTSPDGINWTLRTSAYDNNWHSITYGGGLFVAVSYTGTGNRVMTSPDGINWTIRTSAADNDWMSLTYGNGLFVAVSVTGTGNRVMTSPDGINWTSRTSASDNAWHCITYGGGLFVAVSYTGTGNRVMTSPDGINWTSRTSAYDNNWLGITYGSGLFVAVSVTGTGNRVMTSPDGINWTIRTSAADNDWRSIIHHDGMFVAVSGSGTGNRVMTSGVYDNQKYQIDNPYHKFDDIGTIHLVQSKEIGTTGAPTLYATGEGYSLPSFAVNDSLQGSVEHGHMFLEGDTSFFHLHCLNVGTDASIKYINWSIRYVVKNVNEVNTYSGIITKEDTIPANTTHLTHRIVSFTGVYTPNVKIGSYYFIVIKRISSSGSGGEFNPYGVAVGIHKRINSLGSNTRGSKY